MRRLTSRSWERAFFSQKCPRDSQVARESNSRSVFHGRMSKWLEFPRQCCWCPDKPRNPDLDARVSGEQPRDPNDGSGVAGEQLAVRVVMWVAEPAETIANLWCAQQIYKRLWMIMIMIYRIVIRYTAIDPDPYVVVYPVYIKIYYSINTIIQYLFSNMIVNR